MGFYLENWPNQTATVEIFSGATSLGSIAFTTAFLTAEFKALENSVAFDRMVFTNTNLENGFYAIDDLQFEGTTPVPEPGTIALLGAGLIALVSRARRGA